MANDTQELGQFIPLHYHYNMLSDSIRMEGFKAAINHVVAPGTTALELGGGTGVLSFFAAQKARKVYCVEFNPALVDVSRKLLKANHCSEQVEVIHADAFEYLPPEPVDAVICEMLHVGLLREKQLEVIDSFKSRYQRRFESALPVFIPMATIQAIQPVKHDFQYEGYHAPLVMFQYPYSSDPRTTVLGDPVIYHQVIYEQPFGLSCNWSGSLPLAVEGAVNALRIMTKSVLAMTPEPASEAICWDNQFLILPLEREVLVQPGQKLAVSLDYAAGAPLSALQPIVTGPFSDS